MRQCFKKDAPNLVHHTMREFTEFQLPVPDAWRITAGIRAIGNGNGLFYQRECRFQFLPSETKHCREMHHQNRQTLLPIRWAIAVLPKPIAREVCLPVRRSPVWEVLTIFFPFPIAPKLTGNSPNNGRQRHAPAWCLLQEGSLLVNIIYILPQNPQLSIIRQA